MGRHEQDLVHEIVGGNLVAYSPRLAHIFGVNASLMLSQLIYWWGKGSHKDGWIYKTIDEMYEETGLTRSQQETAIRKLKAEGIIEVRLMRTPATRHFKLHSQKLQTRLQEFSKLDSG